LKTSAPWGGVAAALCLHADDPQKLVNRIDLPRWLGLSHRALAAVAEIGVQPHAGRSVDAIRLVGLPDDGAAHPHKPLETVPG
jgi:hypothetical protein